MYWQLRAEAGPWVNNISHMVTKAKGPLFKLRCDLRRGLGILTGVYEQNWQLYK